jgi:hypothetical protein
MAVVASADTVSVVVAGPPAGGVTVAGAKLQVAPVGNPEHPKVVAPEKPATDVTEIMAVALWPGEMVSELGEALRVKVGTGMLMV